MAKLTVKKLRDVYQTGEQMERLVKTYHRDVKDLDGWNIFKAFRYVANIPYIRDPKNIELLHRPKFVRSQKARFRDCDDKMILFGAWLYRQGIPFKFLAVSHKKDGSLHHVLIQAKFRNGKKKILDPTYPKNKIFQHKPITGRKDITGWITNRQGV
jgi:hypothetical protein